MVKGGSWIKYAVFVLVMGSVWVGYMVTHTPEAMVKKRVMALCQVISKVETEGNASTALKLLQFEGMLGDGITCTVDGFPYNGENSGNTFASLVFRGRAMSKRVDLSIGGMEVELRGKEKAVVRCYIRAELEVMDRTVKESRNCVLELNKVEGKWLFSEFKEDRVIVK